MFYRRRQTAAASFVDDGKNREWVQNLLKTKGISDIKQVAVAEMDQLDQIFIDLKKDPSPERVH